MAGKSVQLRGLCTFEVMDVPERTRRSFGNNITTPASQEGHKGKGIYQTEGGSQKLITRMS